MSIIQIILVLFSLFAITRALRQFRQGALTIAWLIAWVLFWLLVGAVVLSPQTTDTFARLVGVGRGVDFIIYVSVVSLFYLAFRLFVKLEDIEREMTRLVRKMALKEVETSVDFKDVSGSDESQNKDV